MGHYGGAARDRAMFVARSPRAILSPAWCVGLVGAARKSCVCPGNCRGCRRRGVRGCSCRTRNTTPSPPYTMGGGGGCIRGRSRNLYASNYASHMNSASPPTATHCPASKWALCRRWHRVWKMDCGSGGCVCWPPRCHAARV